jgi:hypothetical protein
VTGFGSNICSFRKLPPYPILTLRATTVVVFEAAVSPVELFITFASIRGDVSGVPLKYR